MKDQPPINPLKVISPLSIGCVSVLVLLIIAGVASLVVR